MEGKGMEKIRGLGCRMVLCIRVMPEMDGEALEPVLAMVEKRGNTP